MTIQNQGSPSSPNFSFYRIFKFILIPIYQQMIVYRRLKIENSLRVDGRLVVKD